MEEGDNDLAAFLSYFIAAVRRRYPDACPVTDALIRLRTPPGHATSAHQLRNALEQLPGPFVLMLDDFHAIRDGTIHQSVASILQRPPESLRMVVLV